jgi:hypothetical protein
VILYGSILSSKKGRFCSDRNCVHGRGQISGLDSYTNIALSLLDSLQIAAGFEA